MSLILVATGVCAPGGCGRPAPYAWGSRDACDRVDWPGDGERVRPRSRYSAQHCATTHAPDSNRPTSREIHPEAGEPPPHRAEWEVQPGSPTPRSMSSRGRLMCASATATARPKGGLAVATHASLRDARSARSSRERSLPGGCHPSIGCRLRQQNASLKGKAAGRDPIARSRHKTAGPSKYEFEGPTVDHEPVTPRGHPGSSASSHVVTRAAHRLPGKREPASLPFRPTLRCGVAQCLLARSPLRKTR